MPLREWSIVTAMVLAGLVAHPGRGEAQTIPPRRSPATDPPRVYRRLGVLLPGIALSASGSLDLTAAGLLFGFAAHRDAGCRAVPHSCDGPLAPDAFMPLLIGGYLAIIGALVSAPGIVLLIAGSAERPTRRNSAVPVVSTGPQSIAFSWRF